MMETKLKRQFILYNILVVAALLLVMLLFFGHRAQAGLPMERIAVLIVTVLLLTMGASFLLIRIALKPIEKAWARQLEFVANASHDLRTPLASLRLNLEVATAEPEKTIGQQSLWLANAAFEADAMSALVEELLLLSRMDCGDREIYKEEFFLDQVIAETVAPLRVRAERAGLTIEEAVAGPIPMTGDREKLARLLTNLVDNAILYAGRPGVITVRAGLKKNRILLAVEDQGEGLSPEQQKHLFERFYRADTARSEEVPGSGLGLAIVKAIVEAHHGKISVRSAVGEGTCFQMDFPRTGSR